MFVLDISLTEARTNPCRGKIRIKASMTVVDRLACSLILQSLLTYQQLSREDFVQSMFLSAQVLSHSQLNSDLTLWLQSFLLTFTSMPHSTHTERMLPHQPRCALMPDLLKSTLTSTIDAGVPELAALAFQATLLCSSSLPPLRDRDQQPH